MVHSGNPDDVVWAKADKAEEGAETLFLKGLRFAIIWILFYRYLVKVLSEGDLISCILETFL